jgi:hypothetical protein
MSDKGLSSIDLMIEDLQTTHFEIRSKAKNLGCEEELNEIKSELLQILYDKRSNMR